MIRKFLLTATLAVVAALAAPSASQAAFTLTFQSGAITTVVTDNGVGDNNASFGEIGVANILVNGYLIKAYGTTTSSPGQEGGAFVLSQFGRLTGVGTGPVLTITAFSDGFTTLGTALLVKNSLASTLLQSGGITGQTTVTPGGVSPISNLGAPGFNEKTFTTATSGVFSMSNEFKITGLSSDSGSTTSLTSTAVIPTPAPAGLILAALGLPAFGLLRRKFVKVVA